MRQIWLDLLLIGVIVFTAAFFTLFALAGLPPEETAPIEEGGACVEDMLQLCPERHDPRDIIVCLIERWDDLSRDCKIALVETK
jgi:hypothetical protein